MRARAPRARMPESGENLQSQPCGQAPSAQRGPKSNIGCMETVEDIA
jgi:hypothetical protein